MSVLPAEQTFSSLKNAINEVIKKNITLTTHLTQFLKIWLHL